MRRYATFAPLRESLTSIFPPAVPRSPARSATPMAKPYSTNLRERVVAAIEKAGMSRRQVVRQSEIFGP
jgi:hypothetical protein